MTQTDKYNVVTATPQVPVVSHSLQHLAYIHTVLFIR